MINSDYKNGMLNNKTGSALTNNNNPENRPLNSRQLF